MGPSAVIGGLYLLLPEYAGIPLSLGIRYRRAMQRAASNRDNIGQSAGMNTAWA